MRLVSAAHLRRLVLLAVRLAHLARVRLAEAAGLGRRPAAAVL